MSAQELEKTSRTMAVLDFIADGVSESETRTLSSSLRSQVTREVMSNRYLNYSKIEYTVVDRSKMDQIFDEFDLQNTGCTDIECALRYGQFLSADTIIIGNVGLVGGTYNFNASLIDVETTRVLATADYSYSGAVDNLLRKGIPQIVEILLYGRLRPPYVRWIIITGIVVTTGIIIYYLTKTPEPGEIVIEIPVPED